MSTEELPFDEAEHDGDGYHEEGGEEEPLEHDEPYQFLEAGLTAFLTSIGTSLSSSLPFLTPPGNCGARRWS